MANHDGNRDDAKVGSDSPKLDFIRAIVAEDLEKGRHQSVVTRFPPEPNGYLHIGHAKSICLNFGVALEHGGRCHLRFDDTNPIKEEMEFIHSIQEDIRWLGFDWAEHLYFASDYFEQLYAWAEHLVSTGKAYVDDLSAEEIRTYRGTLTEPGRPSPYRERSVEESLDLFRRMRAGEFEDGARVLRARIDMAAGNINMRDPVLYRIVRATHPRTGDAWRIYPTYDFAHGQSDAIEHITHSLCSLEFEGHRPLYDWLLDNLPVPSQPRQIEFARLNLNYTVMSKRRLLELVTTGVVSGWDDPRMPTVSGLRRRGYTPEALRDFCDRVGVAKRDSTVDVALLEFTIRDDLNRRSPRVMVVLNPLRVVIENYPEGEMEQLQAPYFPDEPERMGYREIPFSRVLYVEREDFREDPPKKFFRLAPGREVRLRWGYFIRCERVIRDPDTGEVTELRCTYDPATRGGSAPDGRKVRGTIHWVSAEHALAVEVRLYDRLFEVPNPGQGGRDLGDDLNPDSLEVLHGCRAESSLAGAEAGHRVQFERRGYFCVDPDSAPGRLVFNRTVPLRDTWAKIEKQNR
jgi:glutaminyl-tRNA synthetase